MKQAATGTLSGCFVWVIAFFMISMCILPIATMIGGFTAVTDFAIKQTGAIICPENTTPKIHTTYFGDGRRTTSSDLQCVDASGEVVMDDPVGYAFLWIGIIVGIGLILTGVLAFFLAAPAGILIAKIVERIKSSRK